VLQEYYPEALSVKALAEELPEIGNVNLRKTLKRMAENGQIKKSARGEYCAFSASSPSPEQEGLSHQEHWSQMSQ
jgi:predicted transcriptional regulator of viral defense system